MPVTEFPTGVPVYTATIGEILATYSPDQTRAYATDAPGCTLEAKGGKWYGDLGTMPKATADALYASGALANLAAGATYRDTSGTQYTYSAGAGWVAAGIPHFAGGYLTLPNTASDGDVATIPQLVGNERVMMRYVAGTGLWVVDPGQSVINAYNQFEVVSATSTAAIIFALPWVAGLFQPRQTWRIDTMVSGVIGAVGSGFRTTFGGSGGNSAKTPLNSALPRGRSNKTFSIKPNGKLDFFEFDSSNYLSTYDEYLSEGGLPRVVFEPAQIGDSFVLRTYILRRIG